LVKLSKKREYQTGKSFIAENVMGEGKSEIHKRVSLRAKYRDNDNDIRIIIRVSGCCGVAGVHR